MSFYLYILYVALTFVRPIEMFAPDLLEYRPMLVLWIVAAAFALTRAISRGEVAARPVHFALLGLLMLIIAVSQVANGWPGGALPAVYDFSTAAMLFVLTCLNLTSPRRVTIACTTLILSMVVIAGFSIAAYHQGYMVEELVLRQGTGAEPASDLLDEPSSIPAEDTSGSYLWRVRYLGFLNDPNDLAQAMVMVLPMLFSRFNRRRKFRSALALAFPAGMLFYSIYLTHSRGAVLGIAALLLFGVNRAVGKTWTTLLLVAALIGASFVGIGGGRDFSTQEESAGQRVEAWYEGLQMLRSNPVFGVGYGNFIEHHERTAHNSFVLGFAELGLPGYFVWMALLVLAYRGLRHTIVSMPPGSVELGNANMLRSALVGYLACAWFLSRTYSPGLFLLLALCISAAHSVHVATASPDTPNVSPTPPTTWIWHTLWAMFMSFAAIYAIILVDRNSGG